MGDLLYYIGRLLLGICEAIKFAVMRLFGRRRARTYTNPDIDDEDDFDVPGVISSILGIVIGTAIIGKVVDSLEDVGNEK